MTQKDIAEARERLYRLIDKKGIRHPDVLKASQRLDTLLNEYEKQSKVRKKE